MQSLHLKLKANDLKGVQVMKKINLLCKSSSHMHVNGRNLAKGLCAYRVCIGEALTQI